MQYRFQMTNANGDLERDYTVTRVGDDYLIQVHLQAVPGEQVRESRTIWLLDDAAYTDFADGRVLETPLTDLASIRSTTSSAGRCGALKSLAKRKRYHSVLPERCHENRGWSLRSKRAPDSARS